MMTPKENFLELLKPDGQPDRMLDQYEGLAMFLGDPINGYLRAGIKPGVTIKDRWGVTISFPEDAPGQMPIVNDETKVLKDITHWRDYVHAPDLRRYCTEGWEEARKAGREKAGDDKLLAAFMGTGIFEECHFLMGFEDTLTNLYEHPEEMHELIDYITEYRMTFAEMLIDGLHPDVIFSHDDWGTKDALFMKPDMWREFFKEPYRKFYGMIRDKGVIAIHHADSYLVPIIDDMIEIGIQVWQGTLPENDIPALQRHVKGKIVLMGGIGAAIDRPDISEDKVRSYVRRALHEYCPGGHYIPSITYGMPGTVYKNIDPLIDDEIRKYNEELHMPRKPLPAIPRRDLASASGRADQNESRDNDDSDQDIMTRIANAVYNGQRNRTSNLVNDALAEKKDPQDIISYGLMAGLDKVGDDFTAGELFVPEMLMSARCMTEALGVLKPYLSGEGSEPVGKVVIGTIEGDLHAIGKNLVAIMMEGNGIDVIDLGTDVPPEKFVETAVKEGAGVIAVSALMTTTMNRMADVVKAAEDAGVRDQFKIMVGGAPITQNFCDSIGADCYTDDAAQAARAAVELLKENKQS